MKIDSQLSRDYKVQAFGILAPQSFMLGRGNLVVIGLFVPRFMSKKAFGVIA